MRLASDSLRSGGDEFVEHARIEAAGGQSVDVNVVRTRLLGKCFCETDDGRLGGGVGAAHGQGSRGTSARQLDDFSIAYVLEMRQYSATQQHGTQKVDLDRTHPFVPVNTFGGTAGACDTRIVDQNVEASEFPKCSNHQGARISGLGDIGSQ